MKYYILIIVIGILALGGSIFALDAYANTDYTCPQSVFYQQDTQYDKYMRLECEGCGGTTNVIYKFENAYAGNVNNLPTSEVQCDYVYYLNGDPRDARRVQLHTIHDGTLVAQTQYGLWQKIPNSPSTYKCMGEGPAIHSNACPIGFINNN